MSTIGAWCSEYRPLHVGKCFKERTTTSPTGRPSWGMVSGTLRLHDDFLHEFSLRPDIQGTSFRAHLNSFAHFSSLTSTYLIVESGFTHSSAPIHTSHHCDSVLHLASGHSLLLLQIYTTPHLQPLPVPTVTLIPHISFSLVEDNHSHNQVNNGNTLSTTRGFATNLLRFYKYCGRVANSIWTT